MDFVFTACFDLTFSIIAFSWMPKFLRQLFEERRQPFLLMEADLGGERQKICPISYSHII